MKVLYSFPSRDVPNRLVAAQDGSLYGTTQRGGAQGDGAVFRLEPTGAFTVLHSFTEADDGAFPGALVQGRSGELFGTTGTGGLHSRGTMFKVTAERKVKIIKSFGISSIPPTGPMILGSDGNFYGTTYTRGKYFGGTVFRLTPSGAETLLHSFGAAGRDEGAAPLGGLVEGAPGRFYGATTGGGPMLWGSIFELSAGGLQVLHQFFDDQRKASR